METGFGMNLGTGSVNTGPNYSTNYLGTGYAYDEPILYVC